MGGVIMVNTFTRLIIQVPLVVRQTGVLLVRIADAKFTPVYHDEDINNLLEANESAGSSFNLCRGDGGGIHGQSPCEITLDHH